MLLVYARSSSERLSEHPCRLETEWSRMEQNGAFFPYCHARHLELLTDATFVFTSIKQTADFFSLSIFNWQTDPNVLKLRERCAAFTVTPNIILTGCRLLTMILLGFAAFLHPQPPHVHMSRDSRVLPRIIAARV